MPVRLQPPHPPVPFSPRAIAVLAVIVSSLCGGPAFAAPAQTAPQASGAQDVKVSAGYRIGAGDVLEINVWNEKEASLPGVVVRPDGKVSLPLVKDVDVLGLTPAELEGILTTKLTHFIKGADVTVVVREIHSKKVYLIGAVNKVGSVPLLSSMTVLQALAEAGGLTDYAKKKKIYVMRTENGQQHKLPFDYDAVVKGEHIEQNINLLPDDTIVVPH